jgi:hypothetical protein
MGRLPLFAFIVVVMVPAPTVPGPVFGVPVPMSVMPVEIVTVADQVQVPAGTSPELHEAAVIVWASTRLLNSALKKSTHRAHERLRILAIDSSSFMKKQYIKNAPVKPGWLTKVRTVI